MTKDQAIKAFGTQVKLAQALGLLSQGSVAGWGEFPPALRQLQIEALTGGKLKAEPGCVPASPGGRLKRRKPARKVAA